jgi:hypothetical protein
MCCQLFLSAGIENALPVKPRKSIEVRIVSKPSEYSEDRGVAEAPNKPPQSEPQRESHREQEVSWGPKVFFATSAGLMLFFWWFLIYSGGVVLHH